MIYNCSSDKCAVDRVKTICCYSCGNKRDCAFYCDSKSPCKYMVAKEEEVVTIFERGVDNEV